MTEQKKIVPKRRFKEYQNTNAWEERKWIDTVDISTKMVNPKNVIYENIPHIGPGNIESFTGRILENVKSVKEENLISGKFHFNPGDIIYGKINPQLGKYAHVDFEGLASADAYVLNAKNGVAQNFLFNILQSRLFYKYSVSVSMRTGMPKINRDELNQYEYLAPSLDEQTQIGNFFKQLDDIIAFHQRKLEKAKVLKSAYLSEMFPAEGEREPKRRFAGFTQAWEQRKLQEITLKIGSGKTPKGGESSYVLEGIPLLRSQNVYDDLINLNDVAYITSQTDEEMKNSRVIKNDVLLNITGASIGRSAVYRLSSPANVNQHVCIVRPVEGYSSDFIQLNLTSPKGQQQINNNQAGGGREGLNFQQIGKISFSFPSIEEQTRISTLFRKLDILITLHRRKLEKLQSIKKAYLNEMFV